MYIIAIGWLYVTLLMAFTAASVIGGILTFIFYGLLPVGLVMYLGGTRARRRKAASQKPPESK